MRRRQPIGAKAGRREPDIKKAYTSDQLAGIGAVSLMWNECERIIHFALKSGIMEQPHLTEP